MQSRITFKRTKVTPSPTDPKYIKLLNEMTTEGSRFSQAMIKFDPNQTVSIADPQMYEHVRKQQLLHCRKACASLATALCGVGGY